MQKYRLDAGFLESSQRMIVVARAKVIPRYQIPKKAAVKCVTTIDLET
jgi:hypothetical protein